MVITEADLPALAVVRQPEALGGRAWVAEKTVYDRTWACRLTPDYPAFRLNSVTPLDPADGDDAAERIARLCLHRDSNRILPLRLTPLAPSPVMDYCQEHGWQRIASVSVLMNDPEDLAVTAGLPVEMVADEDYVSVSLVIHASGPALKEPLLAVLQRVKGKKLPFILKKDGVPVANMFVVRDGAFAGLLDFAVDTAWRRQGIGRAFVATVLQKLKTMNIARIWLQVETDNIAAMQLYMSFGFSRCYNYTYWAPR